MMGFPWSQKDPFSPFLQGNGCLHTTTPANQAGTMQERQKMAQGDLRAPLDRR